MELFIKLTDRSNSENSLGIRFLGAPNILPPYVVNRLLVFRHCSFEAVGYQSYCGQWKGSWSSASINLTVLTVIQLVGFSVLFFVLFCLNKHISNIYQHLVNLQNYEKVDFNHFASVFFAFLEEQIIGCPYPTILEEIFINFCEKIISMAYSKITWITEHAHLSHQQLEIKPFQCYVSQFYHIIYLFYL